VPGYFYLTSDGETPRAPDNSNESAAKVVENWHGQKVFAGHDGLCQETCVWRSNVSRTANRFCVDLFFFLLHLYSKARSVSACEQVRSRINCALNIIGWHSSVACNWHPSSRVKTTVALLMCLCDARRSVALLMCLCDARRSVALLVCLCDARRSVALLMCLCDARRYVALIVCLCDARRSVALLMCLCDARRSVVLLMCLCDARRSVAASAFYNMSQSLCCC
jgi:hypothetical protein